MDENEWKLISERVERGGLQYVITKAQIQQENQNPNPVKVTEPHNNSNKSDLLKNQSIPDDRSQEVPLTREQTQYN